MFDTFASSKPYKHGVSEVFHIHPSISTNMVFFIGVLFFFVQYSTLPVDTLLN